MQRIECDYMTVLDGIRQIFLSKEYMGHEDGKGVSMMKIYSCALKGGCKWLSSPF